MEKNNKTIILILLILLAVASVNSFFTHLALRRVNRHLENSTMRIDSAMKGISASRAGIDSLCIDLKKFGNYMKDVQGRVEYIDLQNKMKEVAFQFYRDSIQNRIKQIKAELDLTGAGLPDIPVDTLRNK
jgi:hypothetical protein